MLALRITRICCLKRQCPDAPAPEGHRAGIWTEARPLRLPTSYRRGQSLQINSGEFNRHFRKCDSLAIRPQLVQLQRLENFLHIRQIPNHPPQRQRRFADQHRCGQDAQLFGLARIFGYIDDANVTLNLAPLVADAAEVHDGPLGGGGAAGDE